MPRKFKVYGGHFQLGGLGQRRCVVATTSVAQLERDIISATGHMRVGLSYLRDYWGQTYNAKEIAAALTNPGALFYEASRDVFVEYKQEQRP